MENGTYEYNGINLRVETELVNAEHNGKTFQNWEFKVYPELGPIKPKLVLTWIISKNSLEDNVEQIDIDQHLLKVFWNALAHDMFWALEDKYGVFDEVAA